MCHISLLYSDYWTTVCFTQPVHICFVHSMGYNEMYLENSKRETLKVTAHLAINLIHPDLLFYHRWNHCWTYDKFCFLRYDTKYIVKSAYEKYEWLSNCSLVYWTLFIRFSYIDTQKGNPFTAQIKLLSFKTIYYHSPMSVILNRWNPIYWITGIK